MGSNYTLETKGHRGPVKVTTAGQEKSRFTVQLTCFADGRKLPLFIIFKAEGDFWLPPRLRPNYEPGKKMSGAKSGSVWYEIFHRRTDDLGNSYPPPGKAVIITTSTATANELCVKHYLKTIWKYREGAAVQQPPSVLVWDSFTAHGTDGVKKLAEELNTTLHRIDGGLTPVLQPLDKVVNKVSCCRLSDVFILTGRCGGTGIQAIREATI